MSAPLTPASITARASSRKSRPFSFGPRFFLVVAIGFLWLIPAWWSPSLLPLLFIWDALAVALFVFDLLRLPAPSQLGATRSWASPLTLGHSSSVRIDLVNSSNNTISATLIDETPLALRDEPPSIPLTVAPAASQSADYAVLPRERGDVSLGRLFLRYRGALAFAERWATVPLAQAVSVLPDLLQAKEQALYVLRTRHAGIERRQRRYSGFGREFESLRDYREGDELRDISWPATARHRHIITRAYEAERSQTVWIVIDAGRLLRAQVQEPRGLSYSKLDYAVNAALSITQVALLQGDKTGLLAYGRRTQQLTSPARGAAHLRGIVDSLAHVRGEMREADHAQAVRVLLQNQTRRALVVWITDFAETAGTPDLIEYVATLGKRHLVLFAAIGQPDLAVLARRVPQSETAMFQQAAALELVDRRDVLLRTLRQAGVLALDLSPALATGSLVNEYLRIKDRNLL